MITKHNNCTVYSVQCTVYTNQFHFTLQTNGKTICSLTISNRFIFLSCMSPTRRYSLYLWFRMVNSGLCSNPILLGLLVGGLVHLFNVSQQPVGLLYYTGCIFNLVNFDSSLIQRKKEICILMITLITKYYGRFCLRKELDDYFKRCLKCPASFFKQRVALFLKFGNNSWCVKY